MVIVMCENNHEQRVRKSIPVKYLSENENNQFNSVNGINMAPLPYPNGWFAAYFSHKLKKGKIIRVPYCGQDIVLYRTMSGVACAIDPYCPHLGAHLGYGASVVGEEIVCPFHGLSFGSDGYCSRAPEGAAVPKIALTKRYLHEIDGVLFVWSNDKNTPPDWMPPALNTAGFSQNRYETYQLRGLCQDMTENSADPAHFSYLHGLKEVSTSCEQDGYKITYSMKAKVFGQPVHMVMKCYGLGYAVGEASFSRLGLTARTQALGTQIEPLSWTFRMIDSIRINRIAGLPRYMQKIVYAPLIFFIHRWFVETVKEDFIVWQNRKYLHKPGLIPGENNMAVYRRWVKQFY